MDRPAGLPVLTYIGADGEHTLRLERDSTTVGRLPDQDLVLKESFVSRQHATINRLETGYELLDQGSSHGTFVNSVQVKRVLLQPGDVLQFGSTRALKIRFQPAPADTGQSHSSQSQSSLAGELLSAISRFSGHADGERTAALEIEQLNFLLNAARKLNAGGAKQDILHALLQLSIQLTSVERGFVFLREGGEMRLALGLRSNGIVIDEDATVSRRAIARALESASKFLVSDTRADQDAASWDSVVDNSIRCIYCIPLRKRTASAEPQQLLGLLYLDSQLSVGHLSAVDHELLDTIATEAATLLDNALLAEAEAKARRAAEELAVAARIHAGLMAISFPTLPYATLQARTVPCLEIGGDFYDALALDDGLYVVIADVSGKGVPASIVAATLQGIVHAQMLAGQGLAEIAALVNRFLCSRSIGKYATMVLLRLGRDGRVDYVNCGQVRPLLVSASGVRPLDEANLMVGLIPDAVYTAAQCQLAPGDRILLGTDGVTEAENSAEEPFGDVRFQAVAGVERIDGVLNQVAEFLAGNPAQDDCTLLEIQYEGAAGGDAERDAAG
jgi:serine phosphatase RsbU (regulator of sigma subunit)